MEKPKRKPPKPPRPKKPKPPAPLDTTALEKNPAASPAPEAPARGRGRPKLYHLPDPDAPSPEAEAPADPVVAAVGFLLAGHQYHEAAEAIRHLYPGQSDTQILRAAVAHFEKIADEPSEAVLGFVAAAARDTFRKCSNISDTGNAIAALKLLLATEKQARDLRNAPRKAPRKVSGDGDPFAVFDLEISD